MDWRGGRLDIRRYWHMLRRWWWLLLLGPLIGVGSGLLTARLAPAAPIVYQGVAYLSVNQVQNPGLPSSSDVTNNQNLASAYSQVVRSDLFLSEVGQQLGVPLSAKNVTVYQYPGTPFIAIVVTDMDPARAAASANRLAQVLIQRTQEQRAANVEPVRQEVDRQIDEIRQRIAATADRLDKEQTNPTSGSDPVSEVRRLNNELAQYQNIYYNLLTTQQRIRLDQVQAPSAIAVALAAEVPTAPLLTSQPRKTLDTILRLGFIGFLLALGLVALIEFLDDRIRDPEELRRRFGLAPLAVLPAMPGLARSLSDPLATMSEDTVEAFRFLRTKLAFMVPGNPIICVASARRFEGTSTVAAHLALSEAQAGKRVVLIDANLRDPALHHFFGLQNDQGLSTVLARTSSDLSPLLQHGPHGLKILASGPVPPNPTELLDSVRLVELLAVLREQADIIIVDSAPILSFADTMVLQRVVDGAVLVVDRRRTGTRTLEQALVALQQTPGTVLGVVLNQGKGHPGLFGSAFTGFRSRSRQAKASRYGTPA